MSMMTFAITLLGSASGWLFNHNDRYFVCLLAMGVLVTLVRSPQVSASSFIPGVLKFPNGTTATFGGVYQSNITGIYAVSTPVECATRCMGGRSCSSFNLEHSEEFPDASPNATGAYLRCSIINGTAWAVQNFSSFDVGFAGLFYVETDFAPRWDTYFLRAAVIGNSGQPPPTAGMIWPTDCASSTTTTRNAILVGLRNFNDVSSLMVDEIKCRQLSDDRFRRIELEEDALAQRVNLSQIFYPPGYSQNVRSLTCPDGSMVTALYANRTGFVFPDYAKCLRPKAPWVVDNGDCRRIFIFRYYGLDPASVMNDPLKNGTAESIWGSQCGTPWVLEAMTVLWLRNSDSGKYDTIFCCRLKFRA